MVSYFALPAAISYPFTPLDDTALLTIFSTFGSIFTGNNTMSG